MISYFPVVTGSLTVSGSVNISGGITASGGISISGSIASASFASTASFVALAQSASNAVSAATASYADALTVAGNLTAQTLVVQTITSSVDFVTGSTRFGSIAANTHQFTGSVSVSGSIGVGAGLRFSSNSSEGEIVSTTGRGLKLYTNDGNSNPLNLTSGGNVLIGTASDAGYKLNLEGSQRINGNIVFNGLSTATGLSFRTDIPDGTNTGIMSTDFSGAANDGLIIYAYDGLAINTGGAERMRITSAGRVIINNSVANDSGDRNLTIQGSLGGSGDVASINLTQVWNSVSYPAIVAAQRGTNVGVAASDLVFKTSYFNGSSAVTNEHMRITDYGNVGIGVASGINNKLYVNGSIRANGTISSFITPGGDNYTLDSAGSFATLVNGAYVDFNSMSGMIIVNNTGTGAVQVFICGGGNTASLGAVVNVTGTMTHSPGVGGYRFTNNTGSTWTFAFQVFRTRGTA
jgi:predicted acyltransferase (DUF342 family)